MNNMCERIGKLSDYFDMEIENKIMFWFVVVIVIRKNRFWYFIFLFLSDRINLVFYFEKSKFLSIKNVGVYCGYLLGLWR